MKSRFSLLDAALIALLFPASVPALAQSLSLHSALPSNGGSGGAFVKLAPAPAPESDPFKPFSRVGFDWHAGLSGPGFDVATPLARRLNLRTGADFFHYSTSFQQQGAEVDIALHMLSAHTSVDWFPFNSGFHLSPQIVFGNNNRVLANAIIPAGSAITLNGQDYQSSSTDPLRGAGSIEFRRVSPGFTLGFGNLIPRTNRHANGHLSFPTELGFYYVGQPRLKLSFTGSGCDPLVPAPLGCQSVTSDPGFQQNLDAFRSRMTHNLSYASFLPILYIGFGYSF
jgi:hypothetical protein